MENQDVSLQGQATQEEVDALTKSEANQVAQASPEEVKAQTDDLLKKFFDKPLEAIKDPISEAFKGFLKGKRRYWQPQTARQIFTAGFLAGQRHTIDNTKIELVAEGSGGDANETVETTPTEVAGT